MSSNKPTPQLRSALATTISNNPDLESVQLLRAQVVILLYQLNDELRSRCLDKLIEARGAKTTAERDAIVDEIAQGYPQLRPQITHALDLLGHWGRALLESNLPNDDFKSWPDDLVALEWIGEEVAEVLAKLLARMVDECLPRLLDQVRIRQAEVGVLPVFQSLGITVEARAVNRTPYRWGTPLTGSGAYSPQIVGTVIVASVHLGVNQGTPSDFYFQSDEVGIDSLIGSLIAARSEMAALREYLQLDRDGGSKRDV